MTQNIVFVGAGGAGVSSLVLLFQELGLPNIIALDSHASELTDKLEHAGVQTIIGQGQYTVQEQDIIIYSDAATESPEVQAAHAKVFQNHKRIFPPLTLFQFLGEISKYMQTIAIAGTHGKSTTTALTATALAKHHPQFGLGIVGAPVNQRGYRNFIINNTHKTDIKAIIEHILFPKSPDVSSIMKKYFFVVEADEYNQHFLYLDSDYAIINNIELDHADVYGNFTNYLQTFLQFANKVKQKIFILPEAPGIEDFMSKYHKPTDTPPIKGVDSSEHREDLSGGLLIQAPLQSFPFTQLLGAHNHANASLALACSRHLLEATDVRAPREAPQQEIDITEAVIDTISNFQGLRRRGELLGHNQHGVPIITDYAHHPTELASTYQALQEKYPGQKITCIFQPHQARRVTEFRDEFTISLQDFDKVIIYDIYAARESIEDLSNYSIQSNYLKSEVGSLKSFTDLGILFAQASGGSYTTNFSDIKSTLDTTTEGVIIIFTAGNLDREVRKYLTS